MLPEALFTRSVLDDEVDHANNGCNECASAARPRRSTSHDQETSRSAKQDCGRSEEPLVDCASAEDTPVPAHVALILPVSELARMERSIRSKVSRTSGRMKNVAPRIWTTLAPFGPCGGLSLGGAGFLSDMVTSR